MADFPQALYTFNQNLGEVNRLVAIHRRIAGSGQGRKHDVQVLNKSGVVLIVACWEACIEDLVSSALEYMIDKATSHDLIPDNVLERVASKHSGNKAWDLAGDGWKKALKDNLKEVLARTTGNLNTPRAPQVNELCNKSLGLKKLSSSWHWTRSTAAQNEGRLDRLVTLRGSIAHRVATSDSVHKVSVTKGRELVCRLAVKSSNRIRTHVHGVVGTHPWASARYKKTS